MSKHSNPEIVQHVEASAVVLDRMHQLTDRLTKRLLETFEQRMGVPLPSVVLARVSKLDTVMCYSSDAKVDEYVTGARSLLKAAFGGDALAIADRCLDFATVVVKEAIGSGQVKVGVHSTGGRVDDYVVACLSVIEQVSGQQNGLAQDFFASTQAFVVWKPAPLMHNVVTLMAPRAPLKMTAADVYKYAPL